MDYGLDNDNVFTGHQRGDTNQHCCRRSQKTIIAQSKDLLDRETGQEPFNTNRRKYHHYKYADKDDVDVLDKVPYLDRTNQL